jgi:hypothetical protein
MQRWAPWALVLVLMAYLFRSVEHDGDGAAYTIQAAAGPWLDRPTHLGWLLPLGLWVRGLQVLHVHPAAAANLAAALVAIFILAVLRRAGPEEGPGPCASWCPPLLWLGLPMSWNAALFAEIYGPLSLAALLCWRGADRGRAWTPLAAAWMVSIHPGALALLPGLLLVARASRASSARSFAAAVLTLAALTQVPGWLHGGRGILDLPPFDRTPWQSLQHQWRTLVHDLGAAGALLVFGAANHALRPRDRRVPGLLLVALGTALTVDRYRDNAGALPALTLAVAWLGTPTTLRTWLLPGTPVRVLSVLVAILPVLAVADAASRHDALARRAVRLDEARGQSCSTREEPWQEAVLRRLACQHPRR